MSMNQEKYHTLSDSYGGFFETPLQQSLSKTPDKTFAAELAPVYTSPVPADPPAPAEPAAPAATAATAPPASPAAPAAPVSVIVPVPVQPSAPQGSDTGMKLYTPQLQVQGHCGRSSGSSIEISTVEFGTFCFLAGIATALVIVHFTTHRPPNPATL